MHGLDLLDEIKRRYPELPVLMVTAYRDDEGRRRAKELGVAEFLTEPVKFALLKVRRRQLPSALTEKRPARSNGRLPLEPIDRGLREERSEKVKG